MGAIPDVLLAELERAQSLWATGADHDADDLLLRFAAIAMTLGGALYSAVQVPGEPDRSPLLTQTWAIRSCSSSGWARRGSHPVAGVANLA